MATIKVLPLPFYKYFLNPKNRFHVAINKTYDNELATYHTEIPPMFFRNGFYMFKGHCWFETNGKAYIGDNKTFLQYLDFYTAKEFDLATYQRAKAIVNKSPKLASGAYKDFIRRYEDYLSQRETARYFKKRLKTIQKRTAAQK